MLPLTTLNISIDALGVWRREELYTDVRLNDTLCERYQVHMDQYGRKVLKRHEKVLTASSDIGMFPFFRIRLPTLVPGY